MTRCKNILFWSTGSQPGVRESFNFFHVWSLFWRISFVFTIFSDWILGKFEVEVRRLEHLLKGVRDLKWLGTTVLIKQFLIFLRLVCRASSETRQLVTLRHHYLLTETNKIHEREPFKCMCFYTHFLKTHYL